MRISRSTPPNTSPTTRRGRFGLAAIVTVGALALAACSAPADSGGGGGTEPDSTATLRVGNFVVQSLNPVENQTGAQLLFSTYPMFDRLIQVSPEVGYAPMLATDWTFSADGSSLDLNLRDDVTFSDGEKFNAEAVKTTLDYYRSAKDTQIARSTAIISDVEVVSEFAVRLVLSRPSTTIFTTLSSPLGGAILSPAFVEAPDTAEIAGTGAYVVDSFSPGQSITLDRRTDDGGIWDPEAAHPARIEITSYPSTSATDNALRGGQVDVVNWAGDPAPYAADIQSGSIKTAWHDNDLGSVGLYLNPKVAPLDEVAVRQAINFAIDRKSITEAFFPSSSTLVQPWPNGMPGHDPELEKEYPFDPDKAEKALSDAGLKGGVDLGEVLVAQVPGYQEIAESIQANLADVGITITLRPIELLSAGPEYSKGANAGVVMAMTTSSIEPAEWAQRLFVNPLWTPGGVSPEITALLEGADNPSLSDEERDERFRELAAYATENALIAPVLQGNAGQLATPRVQGLDELPIYGSQSDYRYLYISK